MIVRDAVADDMDAVAAIYGRSVVSEASSFELEPPSIAEITRRWREITSAGYPYLVAQSDDGSIAGFAYVSGYRPRPAYAATVENSVYVADDHRRRGVARLLMGELITVCRAGGTRQMIAVIGDPDCTGSVALHQALGFESVGRLKGVGRKFNRWIDVALMQKTL